EGGHGHGPVHHTGADHDAAAVTEHEDAQSDEDRVQRGRARGGARDLCGERRHDHHGQRDAEGGQRCEDSPHQGRGDAVDGTAHAHAPREGVRRGTDRIGRAPTGGVAGPWSHLETALPRICDRDTDHGPGRSRCRIMARMSASLLPSDTADEPAVVLHVRTRRIEEAVDLLGHVPDAVSGAWLRHGQGMVALGTAWSVRADGPHRFAAAGAAFRSVAARARVDDEVRVRTSGLIALGSFSYADGSPRPSTLMVPRALLGVHDGESFLTVVGVDEEPAWPTSWRDLFPSSPVPAASAEPLDVAAAHTPDEYQALVTA